MSVSVVYNSQVAASVPHCYAISPKEFSAGCYIKAGDGYRAVFHSEDIGKSAFLGQAFDQRQLPAFKAGSHLVSGA